MVISRQCYHAVLMLLFLSLTTFAGCGATKAANRAASALDHAAATIDTFAWRIETRGAVLTKEISDLKASLPKAAKEVIGNDLDRLASDFAGALETGLICNQEFLVRRVQQSLHEIANRLRGKKAKPPSPHVCLVSPNPVLAPIDPNSHYFLDVWGFNFFDLSGEPQKYKLELRSQAGVLRDVTQGLTVSTTYKATIGFGPDRVELMPGDHDLILQLGDSRHPIAILWQSAVEEEIRVNLGEVIERCNDEEFTKKSPPGADHDFKGWGPFMEATVELILDDNKLKVRKYVNAYEADDQRRGHPDYTACECQDYKVVYQPPRGVEILAMRGPTLTQFKHLDQNSGVDHEEIFGNGELVTRMLVRGDTKTVDHNETGFHAFLNSDYPILIRRHPVVVEESWAENRGTIKSPSDLLVSSP